MVLQENDVLVEWGHDIIERKVSVKQGGDKKSHRAAEPVSPYFVTGFVLVHLRNYAVFRGVSVMPSASGASTSNNKSAVSMNGSTLPLNLEAVFNSFVTTTSVPLIKYFDGNGSIFKVNRMALHKNVVDAMWVAGYFSRRGKSKNAQAYLQFVTRVQTSTDDDDIALYVRTMVNASGRVDTVFTFPSDRTGSVLDVKECVKAVNIHVIAHLNRVDMDSFMYFTEFDENVLRSQYAATSSHTYIVNVMSSTLIPTEGLPSLESVAVVMDRLSPLFSMILRQPAILGDGLSAMYKRTDTGTDLDMKWVVAAKTLSSVFGLSKEDLVSSLARVFLVSDDMARQRVMDIHQGKYPVEQHALIAQHYLPHVPTVTIKYAGRSGFRIGTVLMTNIYHVIRAVDSIRRVIEVASENSALNSSSFKLITFPDSASMGKEDENENENEIEKAGHGEENAAYFDDGIDDTHADSGDQPSSNLVDTHIEDLLSEEDALATLRASSKEDGVSFNNRGDKRQLPKNASVSSRSISTVRGKSESYNGNGSHGRPPNILEDLKRADPELFDSRKSHNGPRYATTCGAAPMRQPIVVTADELDKINRLSPNSYEGTAIKYGSTAELAERNRYICPKVWCPTSRISMTAEQFKAKGSRCPGEGEKPMVFDNKYWNGAPRYPGLLGSTKHPAGLCMPCCFLKNFKNANRCDADQSFSSSSDAAGNASDSTTAAQQDLKYIKGDTLPLEHNRYGMVPSALLQAFNGETPTCGSRDDGSGQFSNKTDCFVRKGIARNRQSFLQCMATVLNIEGGVDALVNIITENLTTDVYITINDGLVCRMFMDHHTTAIQESPSAEVTENDFNRFDNFVRNFLADKRYQAKMHIGHLADLLRSGSAEARREARYHPEIRREFLVYKSLQRFKAYLQDDGIVKVHNVMLGLFNTPLSWLNPGGVNLMVFEQGLDAATTTSGNDGNRDMIVDCEGLQKEKARVRLSKPFVFIVKQGTIYETIHRVRPKTARNRSNISVMSHSSSKLSRSSSIVPSSIIDEFMFKYDSNSQVRALIDTVFSGCNLKMKTSGDDHGSRNLSHRLCISAACVASFLQRVMKLRLKAQVIDFTFHLIGFVTFNEVFVPLLEREVILVGEKAPAGMMYVSQVASLRPKVEKTTEKPKDTTTALVKMFSTLAELTQDDRYLVARAFGHDSGSYGLELVSGNVVPVDMAGGKGGVPREYMENLNVMIGRKLPDERTRYIESMRNRMKMAAHDSAIIAKKLEENTSILREFVFLRSVFNPFPMWYRRRRMRALLEALGLRSKLYQSHGKKRIGAETRNSGGIDLNDEIVDSMLFGPDPFIHPYHGKSVVINRKFKNLRASASAKPDLIITDYDVLSGSWIRRVQSVIINPFSSEEERTVDLKDPSAIVIAKVRSSARDALLKSDNVGMPSCRKNESSSIRLSSNYSSSVSRRRKAHRVVSSCGAWQVFHVVSMLVTRGGNSIPTAVFKSVIANYLVQDFKKMAVGFEKSASQEETTFLALLSDHPSFSKHCRSRAHVKKKDNPLKKSEPFNAVRPLLTELESPTYVPGLYDVRALAAFFDVVTDVIVTDDASSALRKTDYGVHKKRGPQMIDVPGIAPATISFNDESFAARDALLLIYRHNIASFDLVMNNESILFEVTNSVMKKVPNRLRKRGA
jgi:hypothetical protein